MEILAKLWMQSVSGVGDTYQSDWLDCGNLWADFDQVFGKE